MSEERGPARLRLRLEQWLELLVVSSDSSKIDSSSQVLRDEGVLTILREEVGESRSLQSTGLRGLKPGLLFASERWLRGELDRLRALAAVLLFADSSSRRPSSFEAILVDPVWMGRKSLGLESRVAIDSETIRRRGGCSN
jgi:hypothetical protein